jgi:hypothetical protein
MKWRALLLGFGLVALTGWWLGTFSTLTFHRIGGRLYPVDFHNARWIQAQDPSRRSFFRLPLALDQSPDSAVMWMDSDQWFTVWVNGWPLDGNERLVRSGQPPRARPIDLSGLLVVGQNVVSVQVTNGDERPAAFRARLTVSTAGHATDYLTGVAPWRGVSDVRLVRPSGSRHAPRFFQVTFDDGAWLLAAPARAVHGNVMATVPQQVMEDEALATVIGDSKLGSDLMAGTDVTLPADPTDGWLRISASGPYTLLIDGTQVAYKGLPERRHQFNTQSLRIYDVTPIFHAGRNHLALHVVSDHVAAVYVDGIMRTSAGSVRIASGQGWQAWSATRNPKESHLNDPGSLGPVGVVWPSGLVRNLTAAGNSQLPVRLTLIEPLVVALAVVCLWLLSGRLMAILGVLPLSQALVLDAAAHLPVLAVIAATRRLSHFSDVTPVLPYAAPVLIALFVVLTISQAALLVSLVPLHRTRLLRLAHEAWRHLAITTAISRQRLVRLPFPRLPFPALAIGVIAATCGLAATVRLDYEPYWQDELASLTAAQAMRLHLIPQLPSTMIYWKGELFSAIVAVIGTFTGDGPGQLRLISVFWYVACVLAFGLLLVPSFIGQRRWLIQVGLTLLFATAPQELVWARDVRMYQQAQFFTIVFIALFWLALRQPRTRTIAGAGLALVAMYLSHEETFIFLPVIPIVFLGLMRFRWIHDVRWWAFGVLSTLAIGTQYALTLIGRPFYFGLDRSNKPYVLYDPNQFYYYLSKIYFPAGARGGSLLVLSTLALLAGLVGLARRSPMRLFLSAFLWGPVIALSTIFTPKTSRYTFVTLPILFLLAALGAMDILTWLRRTLVAPLRSLAARRTIGRITAATSVVGFFWLALSLTGGFRDYGLAVSRLTHATFAHHHVDYDYAASYVRQHQQPGDLFVVLGPANIPAYYLGRPPDLIIFPHPNKFLFLMERHQRAVDVLYGVDTVLTVSDLRHAIDRHRRIWLVTDQGSYFRSVSPDITKLILSDFVEVREGEHSAVYLHAA